MSRLVLVFIVMSAVVLCHAAEGYMKKENSKKTDAAGKGDSYDQKEKEEYPKKKKDEGHMQQENQKKTKTAGKGDSYDQKEKDEYSKNKKNEEPVKNENPKKKKDEGHAQMEKPKKTKTAPKKNNNKEKDENPAKKRGIIDYIMMNKMYDPKKKDNPVNSKEQGEKKNNEADSYKH